MKTRKLILFKVSILLLIFPINAQEPWGLEKSLIDRPGHRLQYLISDLPSKTGLAAQPLTAQEEAGRPS